jgi:heme-degrading monooxygenase HmoA
MTDTVITRIWHGTTALEHADEYLEFLQRSGVQDYRRTPGNLSCTILRRKEGKVCHFWTVTRWKDRESIRKFAGDVIEKAHYYPEDKDYLLEFEPTVIHCETFDF